MAYKGETRKPKYLRYPVSQYEVVNTLRANMTPEKPIAHVLSIGQVIYPLYVYSVVVLSLTAGYRKVFEQYAAILEQKYPSLAIEGENHPPPFLNQKIAQFLGIVKILLILLVVSGTNIFQHLGVQTPSVWEWTQQNKFYACLMTFFLCNAVEGQLISTGAFEITLNDVPLWSKLETGRIPQPPELFQMIDNHLSMASPQLSLNS
uniref:EOG090X0DP2 n=1 Tax=Daphnia similis TaxID=35528 RepID=A0A4Y7LMZ3_9CRUS|nr:EOG090X0DP2 [Daphnia similis]SVE71313.1 EOG090X0DP2 [Daphnia similis]SVE71947.1 EOG090X0DP2 [Daphnia similis]SVE72572.1 EOG090X0DP2 [Daphnia similis]